MATAGTKNLPDETKISALLLHRKLLTEGQLKAAIDYQRSVGGRLLDTMVKLNLIRAQQVEELLNQLEKGDSAAEGGVESQGVLAPESVSIEELKVHRRLLEKLPPELVERHLLVVFFPTAHLNQRRIILGHGRGVNPEVVERIRSVVGVELYTLELSPDAASKLQ